MREVVIVGVGMTPFGKFPDQRIEELGREATRAALLDAGARNTDIQAAYLGNVFGGMTLGQAIFREVGIQDIPMFNLENACASGSSAFHEAWVAVSVGLYDACLVLGIEQMSTLGGGLIPLDENVLEVSQGLVMPASFSIIGNRHSYQYGTTVQQYAMVSVKNHRHGALNPRSQYKKECTMEEVLSSRMVTDPITVLSCSPNGDGATAAVLCASKVASRFSGRPVRVLASAIRSGINLRANTDQTSFSCTRLAAIDAYNQVGLGPDDIDFAEVHDCFTVAEILHYEDLGFCPKGEGGHYIESGAPHLGGKKPINPSGGLLAKGHPLGATGVAQLCELTWQLRGEVGARQVANASVGLAHNLGGLVTGMEAGACAVHILGR
ncbi:MAG: thiolase family protein [Bacillota bacterium]